MSNRGLFLSLILSFRMEIFKMCVWVFGAPEGVRTPYLLTASQTLYQLSYGPKKTKLNLTQIGLACKIETPSHQRRPSDS